MKVPERLSDSRVLYYVPLPTPEQGAPGEPDSVAYVLIEWFAWNRYTKEPSRHPQYCTYDVDAEGQAIGSTEQYYETPADFLTAMERLNLAVLAPGDEIPEGS